MVLNCLFSAESHDLEWLPEWLLDPGPWSSQEHRGLHLDLDSLRSLVQALSRYSTSQDLDQITSIMAMHLTEKLILHSFLISNQMPVYEDNEGLIKQISDKWLRSNSEILVFVCMRLIASLLFLWACWLNKKAPPINIAKPSQGFLGDLMRDLTSSSQKLAFDRRDKAFQTFFLAPDIPNDMKGPVWHVPPLEHGKHALAQCDMSRLGPASAWTCLWSQSLAIFKENCPSDVGAKVLTISSCCVYYIP
jgi:hypothetical protein